MAEAGKHRIGLKIEKGDKVVIPSGTINLSPNPLLRGAGHLTKYGIGWYAEHVFIGDVPRQKGDFPAVVSAMVDDLERQLKTFPIFSGVDFADEVQVTAAIANLKKEDNPIEWYTSTVLILLAVGNDAIQSGDIGLATWAVATAERFRSFLVFKHQFEDVVLMGNSAKRLVDVLQLWKANEQNSDEEFWQIKLQDASYVFSQLFSAPVTFLKGKAYIGGQQIDGRSARFIDLLFSGDSTGDAILIEIKTPMTPLMQKSKYRPSIHSPSSELAGATIQVADYRATLIRDLQVVAKDHEAKLSGFSPKAILIVGHSADLDTPEKRRSFDLYRSSLSNLDIVTFDELFRKIEHLAKVFSLIKAN